MDQLHEELKEPYVELAGISSLSPISLEEFDGARSDSGIPCSEESSQSDGDYETCDSGPNSEKSSCADDLMDPNEPPHEARDMLISTSPGTISSKQSSQNDDTSQPNSEILSNNIDSFPNYESIDHSLSSGKQKENIPPECHSRASNSDSAIANETSLSCDKSDYPLLKDDCKSCLEASLASDSNSLDSKLAISYTNDKHCNHSSVISSNLISCSKGSYSAPQTSQLKHGASQAIINSMLTARKKKLVQFRSIISDIFDGKILSSVQCLTCDTVSIICMFLTNVQFFNFLLSFLMK